MDVDIEKNKKPKSNTGKYVALLMVVLLALSITFIVLYVQEISRDPNEGKTDRSIRVCLSPHCVSAAESLNKAMNRTAEPCEDFYEYACGGWNRTEVMPDDQSRWQVFDVLDRQLSQNLRKSLSTPADSDRPGGPSATATQKMQKFFHTCMDMERIKNESTNALRRHLQTEYGSLVLQNWPFTGALNGSAAQGSRDTIRTAREFANSLGIFRNGYRADPNGPSVNILSFEAPSFMLDRFSLVNETKADAQAAYVTYGTNVALLLRKRWTGADASPTEQTAIRQMFLEVLRFEKVLANATRSPADSRDETVFQNPSTLSVLARNFTSRIGLDGAFWADYFTNAYKINPSIINENTTMINIREPAYYEKLMDELQPIVSSNNAFFANYLGWRVIEPFISALDEEFQALTQEFVKVVRGTSASPPRAETCVNRITAQFPNAVGSLYVRNYFRKEAKPELDMMIKYLIISFKNITKESYWMDETTRARALEKADKITSRLAYDDYLMDNVTLVDNEHRKYFAVDDYLTNLANARVFATELEGEWYVKGNKPTDWITGPAVVNAFYSPDHNSISFPAGILQAPFLGNGYPKFWNFAAVGTVIGHEITHGFDDQGSQTDGDGVLVDWWDKTSRENFKARAQGIIDQYSSYNHLGVQLKGVNNQGENIADNGGLKESYYAYQAYRREQLGGAEEPRLPGFETHSTDQMFYLSYAQVWCGDYRPQEMQLQAERAHSPGRFRVIGPLQNSIQFARAYRCADDTYMNPKTKYAVW